MPERVFALPLWSNPLLCHLMSRKRRTPGDEPYFAIRTAAGSFVDGAEIGAHSHGWGQLIYAISGVLSVWTSQGSWVAPAGWAIWAPAGVRHSIRFTGATRLRTLYLDPTLKPRLEAGTSASWGGRHIVFAHHRIGYG